MAAGSGYRTSLVLLLIGAFLVRLGWVLHLPVDEKSLAVLPDQLEYLQLGRNLLHQHSLSFYDTRFGQTVYAFRTPGYPLLVAIGGANIRAIRIVQVLLDTSTILATWLLARRWLSPRACAFAAFVVAVNPFLIYFTGLLLSETLFIAMLAWGMALVSNFGGIMLLALSVMVRPSALLLPIALVLAKPLGTGWKPVLRVLLWIAVFLFAWGYRDHRVLDRWVFGTTNGGITLYDGFNPQADGSSNQSFIQQMPELRSMNETQRDAYLKQCAREFVSNHPISILTLGFKKIARTWSPIPLSSEYGSRRLYVLVAAFYSIPVDLLVLWGLWSGSLPRAAKVYLMIPALYFTLAHALSVGSLRYRIPAEVPMAVIVASCKLPVAREQTAPTNN